MNIVKVILAILSLLVFYVKANAQNCYSVLHDFNGNNNGSAPYGSLISDGTYLYGMTYEGGTNNIGIIFRIKPDGTGYAKIFDFMGGANGAWPHGSLVSDGTYMYGMTTNGGSLNSAGIVFKIKPDGSSYTKILTFDYTNGNSPLGSLICDGTYLYGMTSFGGANGKGVIFKIKTDGTGYTKLLDFNGTNGSSPQYSSLISDGTYLYGMTQEGGLNDYGVIFKIKFDGTGYAVLFDFNGANGKKPQGSLISDGTYLYGMTYEGGSTDKGVIFKIKSDGTGYTKLLDFNGFNEPYGGSPYGSLIAEGSYLYGMTSFGGSDVFGLVFKIKLDGTGYTKLLDFSSTTVGKMPFGSFISDGTYLYGLTNWGSPDGGNGTVFKLDILCSNTSTTNINEGIEDKDLRIYPSPTNEFLSVEFESTNTNIELKICNVLGKEIMNEKLKTENGKAAVDVSSLQDGVYFIKVGEKIRKFVKE
ncbi:T9SS type A sorting domain-containing protein [Aurantibacillus circumpalustris]|uniref:T9SS type A sorting domain-containing protein n=1 Tax=Aurantibacillus circumpalustris TaxID=3036359 RepID=UPI00295B0A51|nr:choice-of-anchor tandem repeat GloVer-containing protein [Aurantibacillus circumpalustris]